jgi:hypothetical protein
VASRRVLGSYNPRIRLLPVDLVERECGLVEIGRQHARNFDAGHAPSGSGMAACAHRATQVERAHGIAGHRDGHASEKQA